MIKILIVEQSYLVRKGLIQILELFPEVTQIEVLGSHLGLNEVLHHFVPDILIINTSIEAALPDRSFENDVVDPTKIIHLITTPLPPGSPSNQISIYDSKLTITEKLTLFVRPLGMDDSEEPENSEELTSREKLILKHVALGQTNKKIASKLFISTHTVISHRKNITRKLDIKSVSGLTVYAILNGIIKMDDIS